MYSFCRKGVIRHCLQLLVFAVVKALVTHMVMVLALCDEYMSSGLWRGELRKTDIISSATLLASQRFTNAAKSTE